MSTKLSGSALALMALLLSSGVALAADPAQEPIFGSQLMTERERTEFRARMWAAENEEARMVIRAEHHERMRERAAREGLTLPEALPSRGMGMGPGAGRGPAAGPGAGMGRGAGQPGQGMGPGRGPGPARGAQ